MDLFDRLVPLFEERSERFRAERSPDRFALMLAKDAALGSRTIKNMLFASLERKDGRVKFEFFPAYTHPDIEIPKSLKRTGKSCFYPSETDSASVAEMLDRGIALYERADWL